MSFEEALARSAANMLKAQGIQASIRAQQYASAVPYFAMARSAQYIQDLTYKALQANNVEAIKEHIRDMSAYHIDLCCEAKYLSLPELTARLLDTIENDYKGLYDNWKAGIWHGVGSTYATAMEQFTGTGDLLWAYKHLAHRIAITPRMTRHWMQTFTPTVPNTYMAWDLWKRGAINETTFDTLASYEGWSSEEIKRLKTAFLTYPTARLAFRMKARGQLSEAEFKKYVEAEGWPEGFADKIAGIYEWWPSAYEAFFMWKKRLITKSIRNRFYQGQGYPPGMHELITMNFEYIPTLYDLIRIADYQEVDLLWATRVMQERGMKSRDIAQFIKYLRYRPLREEVRKLTDQLLYRYRFGRITPTDFAAELDKLPVGPTEKTLITDYGAMLYEDELITEQMGILKWRHRMGWITSEDYLAGLINLGIREEKANLIVEQEKAMGYFGYY